MRWGMYEIVLVLLLAGSMLEAISISQNSYLLIGILVATILVFLWSRYHPRDSFVFLCTGLLCSIGAGYALFWLAIPVLCASTGIFLLHQGLLANRRDVIDLLIFSGIITCLTGGISHFNRMLLPGILICLIAFLFLLFVLLSMHRLQKQYCGDLS